jgi:hypothetical protein
VDRRPAQAAPVAIGGDSSLIGGWAGREMTTDFDHLNTLRQGLAHGRARLAAAKKPGAIVARKIWIAQRERQIAAELAFLAKHGIVEEPPEDMTDAELLAALRRASADKG